MSTFYDGLVYLCWYPIKLVYLKEEFNCCLLSMMVYLCWYPIKLVFNLDQSLTYRCRHCPITSAGVYININIHCRYYTLNEKQVCGRTNLFQLAGWNFRIDYTLACDAKQSRAFKHPWSCYAFFCKLLRLWMSVIKILQAPHPPSKTSAAELGTAVVMQLLIPQTGHSHFIQTLGNRNDSIDLTLASEDGWGRSQPGLSITHLFITHSFEDALKQRRHHWCASGLWR